MLVIYPIYPYVFSKKYFSKRDPQSAIIEYELLKKIVYVLFPFFVLYALLYLGIIKVSLLVVVTKYLGEDPILLNLYLTIIPTAFFIVASAPRFCGCSVKIMTSFG